MITDSISTFEHLPSCLQPIDPFASWRSHVHPDICAMTHDFASSNQVDINTATALFFAEGAAALGGSFFMELPHRSLKAPFNLLLLTKESFPLWTNSFPCIPEHFPSDLRDQFYQDIIKVPISMPESSRHVSLGTPGPNLNEALRRLDAKGKSHLQTVFDNGDYHCPDLKDESLPDVNFTWHIDWAFAPDLFRHQSWLSEVPFLLLSCELNDPQPYDPYPRFSNSMKPVLHRFYEDRLKYQEDPVQVDITGEVFSPVGDFMTNYLDTAKHPSEKLCCLTLAELALKLTLVTLRYTQQQQPDLFLVRHCTELAKHFGRLHVMNLEIYQRNLAEGIAENADLTETAREIFLALNEKGPMTMGHLQKDLGNVEMNQVGKSIKKLQAMNLVAIEENHWQAIPVCMTSGMGVPPDQRCWR